MVTENCEFPRRPGRVGVSEENFRELKTMDMMESLRKPQDIATREKYAIIINGGCLGVLTK